MALAPFRVHVSGFALAQIGGARNRDLADLFNIHTAE